MSDASSVVGGIAATASDGSSNEEEEEVVKLRKYVQHLTGKKVRDASLQTGGPGAKHGRKVGGKEKKKKVTSVGDTVAKRKVALPLLETMVARPFLRDLLSNYAV